eukprot:TRINITY_DN1932_c6_g1_i1.p1 TRINITY_DN1932_c6_g1~~TRINITY_DN1932_c6_g1_i1.p1  ORF type:complete len:671 (+),score=84.34 TRINITY_DN1932_c6_g1_i1:74-2014(+)
MNKPDSPPLRHLASFSKYFSAAEEEVDSDFSQPKVKKKVRPTIAQGLYQLYTDTTHSEGNPLVASIQVAIIKGAGCVAMLGGLVYITWQTFSPIIHPLVLAVVFSSMTHPSIYRDVLDDFKRSHEKQCQRCYKRSPFTNTLLDAGYRSLWRLVLTYRHWMLVPLVISRVTGTSRIVFQFGSKVAALADKVANSSAVQRDSNVRRIQPSVEVPTALFDWEAIFWRCEFFSGMLLSFFFMYFFNSTALLVCTAVYVSVITFTLAIRPADKGAVILLGSIVFLYGGTITAYITKELISEGSELFQITRSSVTQAGNAVGSAVTDSSEKMYLKENLSQGLRMFAEWQNINIDAVGEMMELIQNKSSQMEHWADFDQYKSFILDANEKWDTRQFGNADFWLTLGGGLGKWTLAITHVAVLAISLIFGGLATLLWVWWSASIFLIALLALNRTRNTLAHNLCTFFGNEENAIALTHKLNHLISNKLVQILQSILHLYMYHFVLTLAVLMRFGSPFPFAGATMAGLIALFPYFPKYILVPLPLLATRLLRNDFDDDYLELIAWMVIPACLGDNWIFAAVDSKVGPQMIFLSIVMGFYVWGYFGVLLGPVIVVASCMVFETNEINVEPATSPVPVGKKKARKKVRYASAGKKDD